MRAIPDGAGCLCVYLLSPTGGIVQDDCYSIDVTTGARTHVLFTTPSANRVYRMPTGSAEQHIRIIIDEGALLEFVPDATILFAEADFSQTIDITLKTGALLVLHDIVMPGRLARGECLQFRRYRSRLIVRDEGGLLLYDSAVIEPSARPLQQTGILEGFTCWGSFYIVGDLSFWNIDAPQFCQAHAGDMTGTGYQGGLSVLHRSGLSARLLSQRLDAIYTRFADLRRALRESIGLPGGILRK